jgi:hypothetical protein
MLGAVVFMAVVLWACLVAGVRSPAGLLAASVASAWMAGHAFASLSFHGWMACWTTLSATLLVVSRGQSADRRGLRVALLATLGLSCLTLETGLILAVLVLWTAKGDTILGGTPRHRIAFVVLLAVVVFSVWPGSLLRASVAKTAAMYLYRLVAGTEYSSFGSRSLSLVREWGLVALALGAAGVWSMRVRGATGRQALLPFICVGLGYCALVFPFAVNPIYLVPGLAPLLCFVGLACDSWKRAGMRAASAVVVSTLVVLVWPALPEPVSKEVWQREVSALAFLAGTRPVAADGAHLIRHYSPDLSLLPITVDADRIMVRERGHYRAVSAADVMGTVVVVQSRRKAFFGSPTEAHLFGSCRRVSGALLVLYDCRRAVASAR